MKIESVNLTFRNRRFITRSIVLAFITLFAVVGYIILNNSHAYSNTADINSDGRVDIFDLAILASNWLKTSQTFAKGDLTSDGTVNAFDLSVLASKWGSIDSVGKVPIPASGAYFGILTDVAGGLSATERQTAITDAETALGRRFDYDRQFYKWGDNPFTCSDNNPAPTTIDPRSVYFCWSSSTGGHIMNINLASPKRDGSFMPWAQIADGSQDVYLHTLAASIRAWGKPAFFTFQHEPETVLSLPDGSCALTVCYGTSADYRMAWRHIVSVFREDGVTNLSYVWQTTAFHWDHPTPDPQSDYRYSLRTYPDNPDLSVDPDYPGPGHDVIDWIATDPFNGFGGTWKDMSQMTSAWYTWASTQTNPLMIGAFGSVEDTNDINHRAAWFNNAKDYIKSRPKIKALMYYHNNPSGGPDDNWLVFPDTPTIPNTNFNQISFDAFKAWMQDPWFNTRNCSGSICATGP